MIYTGPIDYFFDNKFGKLPYRSIKFEWKNLKMDRFQEVAVVNFVGKGKYTRITEYKHLSGQMSKSTSISQEYPTFNGEPYYPVLNKDNNICFEKYKSALINNSNTIFFGRLAEYKYYNMDQVVARVLGKYGK